MLFLIIYALKLNLKIFQKYIFHKLRKKRKIMILNYKVKLKNKTFA